MKVTSDQLCEDLKALGYQLPDSMVHATIMLKPQDLAVIDATVYVDKSSWREAMGDPGPSTTQVRGDLLRDNAPLATIHVDGSFVHVQWSRKAPHQARIPVWSDPKAAELLGEPGQVQVTRAMPLSERVSLALGQQAIPEELLRELFNSLGARAESYRREKPTLDATPITGVLDYAASCQAVSLAVHHLDEALPTGQAERVAASYPMLLLGVIELGKWLQAKGYKIDLEDAQ